MEKVQSPNPNTLQFGKRKQAIESVYVRLLFRIRSRFLIKFPFFWAASKSSGYWKDMKKYRFRKPTASNQ